MSLSKQFTKRERSLLLILTMVVLVAVYYLCIVQPVERTLAELQTQSEDLETSLILEQSKAQKLEEMTKELSKLLAQPAVSEIPQYNNLQQLILYLNTTLSSASEFDLNFQPVNLPDSGPIVRRVIEMSFTCPNYAAAETMLEELSRCPYRCQMGSLTIAPGLAAQQEQTQTLMNSPVKVSVALTFFEIVSQP